MNVFKFGGASVKNADGVKNLLHVLTETGPNKKLVVISAMGKTTNALETVIASYFDEKTALSQSIETVKSFHEEIINKLFSEKTDTIFRKINRFFEELESFLNRNKSPNYDYVYDQVICYGELISTTIISEYLNQHHIKNTWIDARTLIKTDNTYRDAKVNWEQTQTNIAANVQKDELTITQGFISSDSNNFTTTLGREGSDYTAGIFAYCLHAKNVTIWKDVEGVLNADPREFKETTLLQEISYQEAIELAFYGASVIHPKTLQPLQKKEIPLFVKSFYNPTEKGTSVGNANKITPYIPCFIVKKDLVLLSLSALDFSFFVEENISEIFALFHKYQIKVDLIQNSAISFSVCVDNKFNNIDKLINHLQAKFKVSFNKNVSLYTIRHFTQEAINQLEKGKDVLLKQQTRETVQLVTKD
ncbi:aspartate kinase [Mesonia aquimarina]|uniref:aspartate kinase n=1 Tax=Mesonia aquimarina TaxID=1504967 RepID=UPI000EF624A4|nr:aspartate kinase [Mesonia aquimarina]